MLSKQEPLALVCDCSFIAVRQQTKSVCGGCSCLRSFAHVAVQVLGRSLYRRHADRQFAVGINGIPKLLFSFFCGVPGCLSRCTQGRSYIFWRRSGYLVAVFLGILFCIFDGRLRCPIQGVPLIAEV